MNTTPAIATANDRELVESHLSAFLVERRLAGSGIIPSNKTIGFYLRVFDSYTEGIEPGIAVVSDDGAAMAGHELPFDTVHGKTATGWFTYVKPESRDRGVASDLRRLLRKSLVELGFNAIAFGVDMDNLEGRKAISNRPVRWMQLYGIEELG